MDNTSLTVADKNKPKAKDEALLKQFVTMYVGEQLFGIPVALVQDVLRPQSITPVPLANSSILGSINLRGRIVTVIDMRHRMGMSKTEIVKGNMFVVVESGDELYSLVVDAVGEVMNLSIDFFEQTPPNLSPNWQEFSHGVYRLDSEILVVLDIPKILQL